MQKIFSKEHGRRAKSIDQVKFINRNISRRSVLLTATLSRVELYPNRNFLQTVILSGRRPLVRRLCQDKNSEHTESLSSNSFIQISFQTPIFQGKPFSNINLARQAILSRQQFCRTRNLDRPTSSIRQVLSQRKFQPDKSFVRT